MVPWFEPSADLFARARRGSLRIELSAVVQLELLVGPLAQSNVDEQQDVLDLTERTVGVATIPIDRDSIFVAAEVRAMTGLKVPDALVVASAALSLSDAIIGNDKAFEVVNDLASVQLIGAGTRSMVMPRYIHLDDYIDRPQTHRRSRKTNG